MRRVVPLLPLALALALPALAQDSPDPAAAGALSGIVFNTSFSVNLPLTATDPAGKLAEEDGHRSALYIRSVEECALLLATIARTCAVTGVGVTSQVNSGPGQPDFLYISANVTMDVELR